MRELTPLALTVLRLLCQSAMHPYQVRCEIQRQGIDRMVKMTHGALYHAFDKLVEAGLIEPVETSRAGRRPERTIYRVTDAGRQAAVDRLRQMLSTLTTEYPCYRTALTFLSLLSPVDASAHLGRRAVLLEAELAGHQTAYDALRENGLARVSLLEFEHLIAVVRAELELTRGIVDDLDSGRLTWSIDQDTSDTTHTTNTTGTERTT